MVKRFFFFIHFFRRVVGLSAVQNTFLISFLVGYIYMVSSKTHLMRGSWNKEKNNNKNKYQHHQKHIQDPSPTQALFQY